MTPLESIEPAEGGPAGLPPEAEPQVSAEELERRTEPEPVDPEAQKAAREAIEEEIKQKQGE